MTSVSSITPTKMAADMRFADLLTLKFSDSFQLSCSLFSRRPMAGVNFLLTSKPDLDGHRALCSRSIVNHSLVVEEEVSSCMNAAMHMMHAWSL